MKKILFFLVFAVPLYSEEQVTHSALLGSWSYYYVAKDSFDTNKSIATEQRLIFLDGQNAVLNIMARDADYRQNTTYTLKYSLSLKDDTPYLTLFSLESKEVIGAYLRMPFNSSLEVSSTPSFNTNRQLYRRNSLLMPGQVPSTSSTTIPRRK